MADTSKTQNISAATGARAITPSANDLGIATRMITIGTAGVLVFEDAKGATHTTGTLPPGNYPMIACKILAATTAGQITAWF